MEARVSVHLAFVKLNRSDDTDASALVRALEAALSPHGAEVLTPADDHAAAAWDVAVLVRGEDLDAAKAAIASSIEGLPVGAAKGWTFVGGAS